MKELTSIQRQQLDAYASFVESIVEELRKIPAADRRACLSERFGRRSDETETSR